MNEYIHQLKQLRKSKKLTIIELAKKMGVSQKYIVRLEEGKIKPTKEQVETIKAFIEGKL
ncbi:MAG: helix-turn-helix transcriptional regulator [Candidatus Omnitrophica bacterium]|nr:helix-turn-helix transcriptional regulator [bacterium]MBU1864446.1 helix-turn-helix transcriptional regulator [Candidatus Omnitrophota bacterium]